MIAESVTLQPRPLLSSKTPRDRLQSMGLTLSLPLDARLVAGMEFQFSPR